MSKPPEIQLSPGWLAKDLQRAQRRLDKWAKRTERAQRMATNTQDSYGYYWWRHHADGSTFIAVRDEQDGLWYMPALGHPIADIESYATMLGRVPRSVEGGGSIDQ